MTSIHEKAYHCQESDAEKILEWLQTRDGICIWDSADLGSPGQTWTTPFLTEAGLPCEKPNWRAGRVVTVYRLADAERVQVDISKEVKRFRVATKRGSGLAIVLTDHSTKKVRQTLESLGSGHHYGFDYWSQQCVFYKTTESLPILKYMEQKQNGINSTGTPTPGSPTV